MVKKKFCRMNFSGKVGHVILRVV